MIMIGAMLSVRHIAHGNVITTDPIGHGCLMGCSANLSYQRAKRQQQHGQKANARQLVRPG
jgi:hypothetical protein